MYRWWVFIHLVGVFGFLISHGVSMAVMFRLRKERDPQRMSGLVQLSGSSTYGLYASLLVLLASGVVAGFLGDWWSQGWIWAALALLILTSVAMFTMARPYYRRVALVANALAGGSNAVSHEQFDSILRGRRPLWVAGIGFGSLAAILYLMMFKPTLGLPAFAGGGPTDQAATCASRGPALAVTAEGIAFDTDCLAAPGSRPFTIEFDNRDSGIPHNVAIYTNSSASRSLFVGEIFSGPQTQRYRVGGLQVGSYYFRCDVHPQMDGRFIVR